MEEYVTIKDIAKALKISVSTAWNYARRDDFPRKVAIGGKFTRWKKTEVEKWVEQFRVSLNNSL